MRQHERCFMFDRNGKLTRNGAAEIIREGGSVCIKGVVISDLAALPSEAYFAKGDANAEAIARRNLEREIAEKQAQLNALNKPSPVSTTPGTVTKYASLEGLGTEQLKERAKQAGVPHYWTMGDEKLVAAIREKESLGPQPA